VSLLFKFPSSHCSQISLIQFQQNAALPVHNVVGVVVVVGVVLVGVVVVVGVVLVGVVVVVGVVLVGVVVVVVNVQRLLQPSKLLPFPSSHSSHGHTIPSPQ
jgi:hypothetical protein